MCTPITGDWQRHRCKVAYAPRVSVCSGSSRHLRAPRGSGETAKGARQRAPAAIGSGARLNEWSLDNVPTCDPVGLDSARPFADSTPRTSPTGRPCERLRSRLAGDLLTRKIDPPRTPDSDPRARTIGGERVARDHQQGAARGGSPAEVPGGFQRLPTADRTAPIQCHCGTRWSAIVWCHCGTRCRQPVPGWHRIWCHCGTQTYQ